MINQSFTPVKAPIYRQATDQKVRGSNPCGRTKRFERKTEILIWGFLEYKSPATLIKSIWILDQ